MAELQTAVGAGAAAPLELDPGVAVAETLDGRRVALLYAGTGVAVFLLMGLLGIAMRLSQATVVHLSSAWFYRAMTLHGVGMLTATMTAMMGASWYALGPSIPLSYARMRAAYLAIVAGVAAVIGSVMVGGFAPGWTFLYPLPFDSFGQWSDRGAAAWFVGVSLVGIGFAVFCVDVLIGVDRTYGSVGRALGWRFVLGRDDDPPPPPVIAATVIALNGLLTGAAASAILIAELDRSIDPSMRIDALVAKNLTYFFGHMFANMIMYLAAAAVYVMVPRYCGREWKTTRPLAIAWTGTLIFLVTAYGHHLYMDFVEPRWIQYVSEGTSYMAALPVAVITIYTGVMLIWGSRYRWTLASSLLYVGFAGWSIGGVGAVLDSMIPLNFRFHNTDWVDAHFHTYLLMGVVMWMLAVVAHLLERRAQRTPPAAATWTSLTLVIVGGYGLTGVWFVAGALGIPRRYSVQPAGTVDYSLVASLFTVVLAIGLVGLLLELAWLATCPARWPDAPRPWRRPPEPWARTDSVVARLPRPGLPPPPLSTRAGFGAAAAAAVLLMAAFLPAVQAYADTSTRAHHYDHAAMFALGCMVGLIAGCATFLHRVDLPLRGGALATALVAPNLMLVAMTPSIYGPLERSGVEHALYHLGMVGFGVATGLAGSRLGRIAGGSLVVLAIGSAIMFSATAP